MSEFEFYSIEKKSPIAWVYLNRPEKLNSMHMPAWKELPSVFEELDKDENIRVIIITGKGKCFSAGIDLMSMAGAMPELMSPKPMGRIKLNTIDSIKMMQETNSCVEKCRKPVIAAVHGYCIGAGLDMITACDIRLCTEDSQFSLREAGVAFVADVGVLQRIPLIVGQGVARELAFTAKYIDAARAKDVLLVNQVYKDHDILMEEAEKMAMEIAANSPLAVEATKNVLNFCVGKSIDDGLQYVASMSTNILPSEDLFEAAKAMVEKRKPEFSGK